MGSVSDFLFLIDFSAHPVPSVVKYNSSNKEEQ